MKQFRPVQFAAFVVVLAAYVAVRFWNLTESCLWFDEIFSIHAAEHSWDTILSFVALDLIHPPLFYVLLKVWIGIGGESLFWLRLFPVSFAVIAIFPFISLCRELKLAFWTRMLALFFFAVNGSLIKYAQEVRMYSLLLCLSLFSMWLFARYFIKAKGFIPLVIVNILLVYTHYFGWFVVGSEVAAVMIFQRLRWRLILTMFSITFASFVPWIFAVWQAAYSGSEIGQNIGWMTRPGPSAVVQLVLNLTEPFYYAASSVDPISIFRVSVPILLIAGVAVSLYFADWKRQDEHEQQTVGLLGLFTALPLIIAFLVSWLLPYSIWGTRHLIIVFAPVSILLANAVSKISNAGIKTAVLTLILLFSGYAFALQSLREIPKYSWCAWEQLAVHAAEESPWQIYVFEDLVAYHFWRALWYHGDHGVAVSKIRKMEGVAEDPAYFLPRGFDGVKTIDIAEGMEPRFWIAYRAERIDESKHPLKAFLERGYRITAREEYAANKESAILILLEK